LPLVVVVVVVTLAHLPYLVGWADPNPLLQDGGLSTSLRAGLLPGLDTIDPNTGFTSQALAHLVAEDWLHGKVPWWNPFEGLGTPLAGELQCAAFFPFVLLLAFSNGQVFLYLVLDLISAAATYLLLRRLSLSPWVCASGAVVFGLNGTVSWFRFSPANPVCFLPLMLLGVEVLFARTRRGVPSRWWVLGVALALSLLAGNPEVTYLDGLVVVVWVVVRASETPRALAVRVLGRVALATVSGILVALPALVSFVDYLPFGSVGAHSVGYRNDVLPRAGLASLVFPYLYGPIFGFSSSTGGGAEVGAIWGNVGGYLSVALLLLALIGVAGHPHRRLKLALASLSGLLVIRAYSLGPVTRLINLLPGMTRIDESRYFDSGVELCVVVLACFGVHDLLRREVTRRRLAVSLIVTTVGALGLAVASRHLVDSLVGAHVRVWADSSVLWGFLTLVVIGAIGLGLLTGSAGLRRGRTIALRVVLVLLLPAEAMAMFVVPELSAPRSGQIDDSLVVFLQTHLGQHRLATLGPLGPNYGSYFGLAEINVDDQPTPTRYLRTVKQSLDPNAGRQFDGLSVGPGVADPNGLSDANAFADYTRNYERLGTKYLLVSAGQPVPTPSDGEHLSLAYHDAIASVYQLPSPAPYFADRNRTCQVRVQGSEKVNVVCAQASVLVRDELEAPGWHVQVNGRSDAIRSSSLGQEVVAVPAGTSTIIFTYRPAHADAALIAALIGLILLTGAAGYEAVRRNGRVTNAGAP
jgi:hypothetical protein